MLVYLICNYSSDRTSLLGPDDLGDEGAVAPLHEGDFALHILLIPSTIHVGQINVRTTIKYPYL